MEVKINGPKEMPKMTILEQRADYIRSRHEYSNGLIIIYTQNVAGEITVNPNYSFIQNADGSYTPNYNSPNQDFIDER